MRRQVPKEIRDLALTDYLNGVALQEINRRYGLHKSYLNNVRRRRGFVSQTKMREWQMWDRAVRAADGSHQNNQA